MKLPVMKVIKRTGETIAGFAGLDQRPKPTKNAFAGMKNMTCERLPVMAARQPRVRVCTLRKPGGLFAHEKLCWADYGGFYYDGERKFDVTEGEKQFVRMGAYVLIWPDEKYYNTQTGEHGELGAAFTTYSDVTVEARLCKLNGELYEDYTTGSIAPEKPSNGQLWMDTSVSPNVLRYYSTTAAMWQSVPTVYTKISSPGIGKAFLKNDGIEISGMTLEDLNGSFYIVDCADDYLVVVALIAQPHTQQERVTVTRSIPKMDFVCENDNRLWGCSNEKHEIYGSVLGDAKNWNRFLGLDSDSYAATVGTAGDFTGVISHAGNVLFFKENTIHQLMGTAPRNFTLTDTVGRGVAKGSEKSIANANEHLLYKGTNDVCMMGLSTMQSNVSGKLGRTVYTDCTAGAVGDRYFMCARQKDGSNVLLVYDAVSGEWCCEDSMQITHFAALDNELYMLNTEGEIWSAGGNAPEHLKDETYAEEGPVSWEVTTGPIGLDEAYSKYISGVQLHVGCSKGTTVKVDVQYDNEPCWQRAIKIEPMETRSMMLTYTPRRCRIMRLKIYGTGPFELYSISRMMEQGSDIYRTR